MNFASYSDEIAAPVRGHRAASSDALSWGPHNILAVATRYNVQFTLPSQSTHEPSAPMRCDAQEDLKPVASMAIERVAFAPYVLSDAARGRVLMVGGGEAEGEQKVAAGAKVVVKAKKEVATPPTAAAPPPPSSATPSAATPSATAVSGSHSGHRLGTALCALKTSSSTVDIIAVERVHPSFETMRNVTLGPRKVTLLPQLRPAPLPNAKRSTAHIPAFSYHLIDFHWLSAASLVLVTTIGLIHVDVCGAFDDARRSLTTAALDTLRRRQRGQQQGHHSNVGGGGLGGSASMSEGTAEGLLDDLLAGIEETPSSNAAVNMTPTTLVEPSDRIASWPAGFGPICSAIVELEAPAPSPSSSAAASGNAAAIVGPTAHHLLLVSGLMAIAGRQQNVLIGYDLTSAAAPPQPSADAAIPTKPASTAAASAASTPSSSSSTTTSTVACLCRCAFALHTTTKSISVVSNFARVASSAALAASDSFVPSALSAAVVASSAAGVAPRGFTNVPRAHPPLSMVGSGRAMAVVEVVMSAPSGTILAHVSTVGATVRYASPFAKGFGSKVQKSEEETSPSAAAASTSSRLAIDTVTTSATGAAIIARWGAALPPVGTPAPSATNPVPAAQVLVAAETIATHHQDANVCRIVPFLRGGGGECAPRRLMSPVDVVTFSATVPPSAPRPPATALGTGERTTASADKKSEATPSTATSQVSVSVALAATIDSHYALIGSECITIIGIVRTGGGGGGGVGGGGAAMAAADEQHNLQSTTITAYSDTILDSIRIAAVNHHGGVADAVPPFLFVGGLALHPSGAAGAALAGVSRQRKDELRLIPFNTMAHGLYTEAARRFVRARTLLTAASGTANRHFLSGGGSFSATDLPTAAAAAASSSPLPTLASVHAPHCDSIEHSHALGKLADGCQHFKEYALSLLTAPRDETGTAAAALFSPGASLLTTVQRQQQQLAKAGAAGVAPPILNHRGVYQLGADLAASGVRATLAYMIACIVGEAEMVPIGSGNSSSPPFPYDDRAVSALYAEGAAWDAALLDPSALIPTIDTVPPPFAVLETLAARLAIAATELSFVQLETGKLRIVGPIPSSLNPLGVSASERHRFAPRATQAAACVWSAGRQQFGADLYRRMPMSLPTATTSQSTASAPWWQRSLSTARLLIRSVEGHRVLHAKSAADWVRAQRRRLTMEALLARSVAVMGEYAHGGGGPSKTASTSSIGGGGESEKDEEDAALRIAVAVAVVRGIGRYATSLELTGAAGGTVLPSAHTRSVAAALADAVVAKAGAAAKGPIAALLKGGSGGGPISVQIAEPSFLADTDVLERAEANRMAAAGGAKRPRAENEVDFAASAFVPAPLCVIVNGAAARRLCPIDAATLGPIPRWGAATALRCSSGCGQQFAGGAHTTIGVACPLCQGQLVLE